MLTLSWATTFRVKIFPDTLTPFTGLIMDTFNPVTVLGVAVALGATVVVGKGLGDGINVFCVSTGVGDDRIGVGDAINAFCVGTGVADDRIRVGDAINAFCVGTGVGDDVLDCVPTWKAPIS